jgi:predicted RNA binding protein YcfA (HicA-like mRNA interferase family)
MAEMPRVTGNQVITALQRAGYTIREGKGSHVVVRASGGQTTVVARGNKTLHPEQLHRIRSQLGLSRNQFIQVLTGG